MSRGKIIGGVVIAVVVLAAIGSTSGGSKNTLAPTSPPEASSAVVATDAASVTEAPATEAPAEATSPSVYSTGDRVRLGDEEYMTVEKAEKGYTSDLIKPAAGNINVSFLIAFEGINPSGASYNPFYFKAKDDSGFEYTYSPFGKEPSLSSSNDLQPGKIARGWMTFEIPKSAKTMTLTYTPGFLGEPVEFSFKL